MARHYMAELDLTIIFRALANAFLAVATIPHVELFS
jgi:hypothetical protein